MFKQGIKGVDFIVLQTLKLYKVVPCPNKIQLGVHLTEGLGAGANPDVGQSAIESISRKKCWIEILKWYLSLPEWAEEQELELHL
jgi:cell division GTPase FtsZ